MGDGDEAEANLIADLLRVAGLEPVVVLDGVSALRRVSDGGFCGAVLDVDLPGVSGWQVCDVLRQKHDRSLSIVLVSGARTRPADRAVALLVGADDYLPKPVDPDTLLARLRGPAARRGARPASSLTTREHEVLALLAEGLDQAEIARRLVISSKTVSTHIEHVLTKLNVRSRAQAVAVAYRDALVP